MKNRKIILSIVVASIFIALIVAMSYIPFLGYITIGTISFTTIHIVVLIGAMLFGKWFGLGFGTVFGFFSFLAALQKPGMVDFLFVNPFVSILPRAAFGFLAGLTFDIFRKRMKLVQFLEFSATFAGFLTILHSILTLLCLYVFGYLDIFKIEKAIGASEIISALDGVFGSFMNFLVVFVALGTAVETLAAVVIVPLAGGGLYKVFANSDFTRTGLITIAEESKISKNKVIILLSGVGALVLAFVVAAFVLYFVH